MAGLAALVALCGLLVGGADPGSPFPIRARDASGVERHGFINAKGEVVIAPTYDGALFFEDGLARVEVGATQDHGAWRQGKYGFIDATGRMVIPPTFDTVGHFSGGRAKVKIDRRWGYIDKQGAVVIKPQFGRVTRFHQGRAAVEVSRDSWAIIDPEGEVVVAIPDADMSDPAEYSEGLIVVQLKGRKGLRAIGRDGRTVFELPHRFARGFSEGLCPVRTADEGWGFVDRTGAWALGPGFQYASGFREGLAAVTPKGAERGTTAFIDPKGKVRFQVTYDRVGSFSGGRAQVRVGEQVGYLDPKGKLVIPIQFGDPEHSASWFRDGLAMVRLERKGERVDGYIDTRGRVVWPR